MDGSVLYEKVGTIATLTLNRPEALNAITVDMIESLIAALSAAQADDEIRALILTGAGRAFCVGADIKQLKRWAVEPDLRQRFYRLAPEMFQQLEAFPHPIIAAVNGIAAAGGFELCCFADIVVAAQDAMIGDGHANYVGFGPISAVISPGLLPPKLCNELLFCGEMWSAARMEAAGFVNRVVHASEVMDAALGFARRVADKQPLALACAKMLMRKARAQNSTALMTEAFERARENFLTRDFEEGLKAFEEKRAPVYIGR